MKIEELYSLPHSWVANDSRDSAGAGQGTIVQFSRLKRLLVVVTATVTQKLGGQLNLLILRSHSSGRIGK